MKPGFHLWMFKPKCSQSSGCTKHTEKKLNKRLLPESWWWNSWQQGTTITSEVYREILKKLRRTIQNTSREMVTFSVVLIHANARPHTAACPRALRISTTSWLTTFLTALISFRATITCLPTWRTGWDHSTWAIMRSWRKGSKRGWANRRQTFMAQTYKNSFSNTSASIPAVTTLWSSLSMYVFFVYNNFFVIACFVNSLPVGTFGIALVGARGQSIAHRNCDAYALA
jgi:hypothetical protein